MGIKKLIKKAAEKAIEKNGRAKIKLEKVKFSELRLAIENYNRKNDRTIDDIIFVNGGFVLVLEDQREDDMKNSLKESSWRFATLEEIKHSEDEAVASEPVAQNITENKVADNAENSANEDLERSEKSKRNRRRRKRR
jgi:hypothetical protein